MNSTHRPCCWLVLILSLGIIIGHFLPCFTFLVMGFGSVGDIFFIPS